MSSLNRWVQGARPKTLGIGVAPVLVGTAAASVDGPVIWWRAAAALVVSVALQVGVNYANDYFDGIKGADASRRGPVRLTASGLAPARSVRKAALVSFGVAAGVGLALAAVVNPRLVLLGAAALAAGWFYSGGKHPYGYYGWGEVAVLAFFGFAATAGSAYVQLARVPPEAWWGSIVVGAPACAVLVVNNLRDLDGDRASGKRTLVVLVGVAAGRRLYGGLVVASVVASGAIGAGHPTALVALAAGPLAVRLIRRVLRGSHEDLLWTLGATVRYEIALAVLLTVGLAVA